MEAKQAKREANIRARAASKREFKTGKRGTKREARKNKHKRS
jgi:hypothetical protein